MSKDVFADFRQAWGARFPGSELPDAWEEDVRANLKKHRTKVAILREELEKEEMYVEYLQTLLKDIERMKSVKNAVEQSQASLEHVDSASKQEFLDSHLSDLQKNNDAFVTVINVSNEDKSASLPSKSSKNNRDSLRSVSSPTTTPGTSPLISSSTEDFISREGLAAVNSSSISPSNASSKEQIEVEDEEADRGQPDGHDDPNDPKKPKSHVAKDESNR